MNGLILAVLLASTIAVATGIYCYECEYKKIGEHETRKECKAPEYHARTKNCGEAATQCVKFAFKRDDVEIRKRSCGRANAKEECVEGKYLTYNGTTCVCNGDKCNGASTLVSSFAIIPAILGTAYAFRQ